MTVKGKVLVTGATGYIAKHIILQLLEGGYHVRGSVRDLSRSGEVRAAIYRNLHANIDLDECLDFVVLDLTRDDGWDAAMAGIDILLHTASPVPVAQPKNADDLIIPAVEGTLRALRAASKAGIERVVLTSSVAAIMYGEPPEGRSIYDERDWSDLSHKSATPYVKSKTLAERAAWDYVNGAGAGIALTVINPAMVFGPPLDVHFGASFSIIERILKRADPAVPNIGFVMVDVRDVAQMHVRALEIKASIGNRYVAVDRFIWYRDIVGLMARKFPDQRIITRKAPDWLIQILARFDGGLASVVDSLGKKREIDGSAARRDLDIDFIDAETTIIDSARYLIDHDLV